MKRFLIIGACAAGLSALGAHAQGAGGPNVMMGRHGPGMMGRLSPDDESAMIDAHFAALHAGLRLSAEQEKLWPPVEDAMRNLARLHVSHVEEQGRPAMDDPVGMLRRMSGRMSQAAEALGKLADVAAPLYATLDDSQKRRLRILYRMRPLGMMGESGAGIPHRSSEDDEP